MHSYCPDGLYLRIVCTYSFVFWSNVHLIGFIMQVPWINAEYFHKRECASSLTFIPNKSKNLAYQYIQVHAQGFDQVAPSYTTCTQYMHLNKYRRFSVLIEVMWGEYFHDRKDISCFQASWYIGVSRSTGIYLSLIGCELCCLFCEMLSVFYLLMN